MIELGGNIKLAGFENLEPAKLIVVKKIVGNYVKNISEKVGSIKELLLEFNSPEIKAKLSYSESNAQASESDSNLFFALDKVLSKLKQQMH